jgi:hypothetical protein
MAKLLKDFPVRLPADPPVWSPMQPDWEAAPCGMSRDSGPLTRANFDALCDELDSIDPYGSDWDIARFEHFTAGWLELIFCRPGSPAAAHIEETRDRLAAYPCLNEDLWVEYDAEDNGCR